MLLAGLLRSLVDLAHDEAGEAGDHQHDDGAGQGDEPALAARGESLAIHDLRGNEKSRGALRQTQNPSPSTGRDRRSQGLHE